MTVSLRFLNSWRAVHTAADAQMPVWRRVFLSAVQAAQTKRFTAGASAAELDQEAAKALRAFEVVLISRVPSLTLDLLADGAASAVTSRGKFRTAEGSTATLTSFNKTHSETLSFVQKYSARLITGLSVESREAVNEIIRRAFADQLPPTVIAKSLRNVLGMTSVQAVAWYKQFGATPSAKGADKAAQRYIAKRALSVARTETIRVANEGQRQLWTQMVSRGVLPLDISRVWVTTPDERLCPICSALDGAVTSLKEMFAGGFDGPPAHPMCRCTQALRTTPRAVRETRVGA